MASKVYFSDFRAKGPKQSKIQKIQRLFDAAGFSSLINPGDLTAVKLHFGEIGNDGFISPVFVRQVVEKIKEAGGSPFLTDTNTLYTGKRSNGVDHITTAVLHGFDYAVAGAPVIIADGLKGGDERLVTVGKKHFDQTRIAGAIADAGAMMVLSHFKGHEMAGFGGAIKNLAMGCATPKGKQDQHATRPVVNPKKCVGCGLCVEICPTKAIAMTDKKAIVSQSVCIGCGECMAHCQVKAFQLNWDTELKDFTEKMTEYALGAVTGKQAKTGYMNFLMNITPDCDCAPWSDAPIVADIGILVSNDPVALDQACLDLVNDAVGNHHSRLGDSADPACKDKFKALHTHSFGTVQLSYGEEIGLGNRAYELIKIG